MRLLLLQVEQASPISPMTCWATVPVRSLPTSRWNWTRSLKLDVVQACLMRSNLTARLRPAFFCSVERFLRQSSQRVLDGLPNERWTSSVSGSRRASTICRSSRKCTNLKSMLRSFHWTLITLSRWFVSYQRIACSISCFSSSPILVVQLLSQTFCPPDETTPLSCQSPVCRSFTPVCGYTSKGLLGAIAPLPWKTAARLFWVAWANWILAVSVHLD